MKSSALAQIVKIDAVEKHPNADSLDICTVGGWKVVTKLGEFNPGDVAVYCRIDSWIPTELAPFLSKGQEPREYNGVKGERLKTVKLRGQLSQGLLMSIPAGWSQGMIDGASQTQGWTKVGTTVVYTIGADVSELLGIQKWEAPIPAQLAGTVRGPFPTQVPKTDEERIQNLTNEWPALSGMTYEITEKLEGSSMTVGLLNGEFIVCSRNLSLKETEGNTLWAMARKYDIETQLKMVVEVSDPNLDSILIQGELVGEGVQGNHYQLKGQDFYVFAIYDARKGEYLSPESRRNVVRMLGLKHVPVVHEALSLEGKTPEEILAMADGDSALRPGALREGLVFKQLGGQAHWKAVSNKYLLKHG